MQVRSVTTCAIWDGWLQISRTIDDRWFRHVEYEESVNQRDIVAAELRTVLESHHAHTPEWTQLVRAIGFPSLARVLQRSHIVLPSRTVKYRIDNEEEGYELTTRRGNLCEVLAAEYAVTQMGFEVPIRRLRYNPNPDQSMKGDDALGFRFPEIYSSAAVLVGEAKFRSRHSPSEVGKAVDEAYSSLRRSHRSYPVSMDFVATVLEAEQDHERALWVRQMRAQLQSGSTPVERHYLIVLGTVGRPVDPFAWLEAQTDVMANVTCVNIVFAPGIQSWLHELFDGDA